MNKRDNYYFFCRIYSIIALIIIKVERIYTPAKLVVQL